MSISTVGEESLFNVDTSSSVRCAFSRFLKAELLFDKSLTLENEACHTHPLVNNISDDLHCNKPSRVLVRFRPLSAQERSKTCIACTSTTTLQHTGADGSSLGFTFDGVHGASTDQADIFYEVQDIVCSVLHGQNGCIMAYGQTGLLCMRLVFLE